MTSTTVKEVSRERIDRRVTIEKKKKPYVPMTSKEIDEKKVPLEKRASQTHQTSKQQVVDQTVSVFREKEIVYQHYRKSYNEILNFTQRLDE